jgi:acetylornithine/N-succinyldiaminopimelate aminotransferase
LFAYQRAGIDPDIVTLGKGLGGGVPLAALLAKREVSCFDKGDQGGTFSGNPLTTAIGYAVLSEVAKPAFLQNVERTGNYLREQLQQLSNHFELGEVRGDGLLLALEIPESNAEKIAAAAFDAGLLINATRPNVLRFMPALNVSAEEVDLMIGMLKKILADA